MKHIEGGHHQEKILHNSHITKKAVIDVFGKKKKELTYLLMPASV